MLLKNNLFNEYRAMYIDKKFENHKTVLFNNGIYQIFPKNSFFFSKQLFIIASRIMSIIE